MRLYATIAVYVQAADVVRAPTFLDKVRRIFGGSPDLRTGTLRSAIEATALVEGVRDALRRIGATNAVSLVIDDTVLFHDRDNTPDDLGDLFLAFSDNAPVFGGEFHELRLAVEHREGGLRVVLETQARPVHPRSIPPIRVIVSGRLVDLEPRTGEDAEAYRARVAPLAADARHLETHQLQFESFVQRVRDAIAAALPTARAEIESAEARVVRPDEHVQEEPQRPDARDYDPYEAYYPNAYAGLTNAVMWSALFAMAVPPHVVVIDPANHVQGFVDDAGLHDTTVAPDTSWYDATDTTATTEVDTSTDTDAGGDWWSDVGGDTDY